MITSKLPCFKYISTSDGLKFDDTHYSNIEIPNECPNCGKSVYPSHLVSLVTDVSGSNLLASIFLCNSCKNFIYTLSVPVLYKTNSYIIAKTYPPIIENAKISNAIENLSPNFSKIFNQAVTAESSGLDEICGVGYRKSLEFLIKDFAIHKYPDKKETIENMPLGPCINAYCDNEKIKTLSIACAWIGNDETHYVRKHEGYSINELKAFIKAVITYIDSELSFEEAEQLLNPDS